MKTPNLQKLENYERLQNIMYLSNQFFFMHLFFNQASIMFMYNRLILYLIAMYNYCQPEERSR